MDITKYVSRGGNDVDAKYNALIGFVASRGYELQMVGQGAYAVVKAETAAGDYTNPIHWTPGDHVDSGKWYYTDDKDLPHEAISDGEPWSFIDRDWFDFV